MIQPPRFINHAYPKDVFPLRKYYMVSSELQELGSILVPNLLNWGSNILVMHSLFRVALVILPLDYCLFYDSNSTLFSTILINLSSSFY